MIGTSICPEISISRTQPLPIPKIFPWAKKFRKSVKNQRSEGLLKGSLCWCLRLTWKCHYYPLIESRNQRAAKNFDCVINKTQESCNNSTKNFSIYKNTSKNGKERAQASS